MKDGLEQFGIEVMTGERRGFQAGTLRLLLYGLSFVYRGAVSTRLWLFRKRIAKERILGCMVVSIGNITTGGTGKTPVVEMFARALTAGGRRVAILSRGYKSEIPPDMMESHDAVTGKRLKYPPRVVSDTEGIRDGMNSRIAGDEPFMLAQNLPGVSIIVGKDRVASGRQALKEMEVDTLLLDDGLQYLKLRHRLDIILVDTQAPFGNGYMLPRGFLREPRKSLRRASYIFLTKCNGESNEKLIAEIRKYNRTAEIIECRHKPMHLTNIHTREILPLDFLKGKNVATLSGIARPESFERGIEELGATIRFTRRYTDHHRYEEGEINDFILKAHDRDADLIVTTEKDSVRLPEQLNPLLPVYFLRVEIEILTGHETWEHCVQRICQPHPIIPADRWF
jgi:tetraacyldisaccharide 4'-kinase